MEIILNGIPISEEQCIGDSLPYINAAFTSLKNAIIESSTLNDSTYVKPTDISGFYPNTGGTVYGGVQIGGPGLNSAAILRLGKTVNSSDGELVDTLPTIFCGTAAGVGNDLFINANSANGKILLRTGTSIARINAMTLDANGNANVPTGNVCIGATTVGTQKLDVNGGNIKISSPAAPALILNNSISNSIQWNSKLSFQSNNVAKYELGVDPTQGGLNQFYLYDSVAQTNRFIVRNDGKVYIPGNVGIGTEPVAGRTLKVSGDIEIGGGLLIGGTFSTGGVTSTGPISGTGITGTTGNFSGKVMTINLESSGPVSGTVGNFTGKITTTSVLGIESYGPIAGTAFTGTTFSGTGYSGGPISGTTGTFTGKIATTSVLGIESSGPVSGTTFSGTTFSGTTILGTTFSGNVGRFGQSLTTQGILSSGSLIVVGDATVGGKLTTGLINVTGELSASGNIRGAKGIFANGLEVTGAKATFTGAGLQSTTIEGDTALFTTSLSTAIFRATGSAALQGTLLVAGPAYINNSLTVTGVISCSNDVIAFATSDERLKKNIIVIPNALEKLSNIRGCEFEWNEELAEPHLRGKSAGLIAQEVETVFPEAVLTRDNGYKAVRYEYIIPLLVEAIKDLQDEIERLKPR